MELDGEDRWREAMRKKGKVAVQEELQRRYGSPGDLVYDIVHTPPFPTREFCSRWCADEDNRLFTFSRHTVYVISAVVILLIAVIRMMQGLNAVSIDQAYQAAHSAPPKFKAAGQGSFGNQSPSGQTTAGQSTVGQSDQSSGGATSTSSTSSDTDTTPSACAYITYATTRCAPPTQ